MVPMVRHETDFTILRYDFSLMLMLFDVNKKALLESRRAYKYFGKNSHLYRNHLLKCRITTHAHTHRAVHDL